MQCTLIQVVGIELSSCNPALSLLVRGAWIPPESTIGEQKCEVEWHTLWIQVRYSLESTSSHLQNQVMALAAGQNADFLKIELFIVSSGMLSSGS